MGGAGAEGLIEGHLFAQWTHAFFGYGGTALALYQTFRVFRPAASDVKWVLLAVFSALSFHDMGLAWIAKNDWGVACWVYTGCYFLFGAPGRSRPGRLAGGVFIGAAFAGKFTTAFAIAPLLAAWFISRSRKPSEALEVCGAMFLAALPIFARNAAMTGNPVFPAFTSLFDSDWVSLTWRSHQDAYEAKGLNLSGDDWKLKLQHLYNAAPYFPVLLLAPLARRSRVLLFAAVAGVVFWGLRVKEGLGDALRLAGPSLLIVAASPALILSELKIRFRPAGYAVFLAILAFFCHRTPLITGIWGDLILNKSASPEMALRMLHMGGDSKAWLRLNAKPEDVIVTSGDNQLYYISHLRVAAIDEQPDIDLYTYPLANPVRILRVLRAFGAKYWLDTVHWTKMPWTSKAAFMNRLIDRHPEAMVYVGRDSMVIDLTRIYEAELASCPDGFIPKSF